MICSFSPFCCSSSLSATVCAGGEDDIVIAGLKDERESVLGFVELYEGAGSLDVVDSSVAWEGWCDRPRSVGQRIKKSGLFRQLTESALAPPVACKLQPRANLSFLRLRVLQSAHIYTIHPDCEFYFRCWSTQDSQLSFVPRIQRINLQNGPFSLVRTQNSRAPLQDRK